MTEDNAEFVDSFTKFLERRLEPQTHRALLNKGGWDAGLMAELDELGWSILARPAERGGLGVPLEGLRGLMELAGEKLVPGPLAEQLILPAQLNVPADTVLAFADPAVSFDWAFEMGTLVLDQDTLNGTIELVRFAAQARHIVFAVPAQAGGADDTIVVLAADDPAITITDLPSADPTSHYARVVIKDRVLSADEIIAAGPAATELTARLRIWLRIFAACELAGIARRVLADTVAYVSQRQQFGRPIGSFQAVKHLLAGMAQAAMSLEALCEATIGDAAAQTLLDLEISAWTLKAYASRAARKVCEDGLQAHGGIGFTVEYDLHWYLRRALALRSWYGDERELLPLIGHRRLAKLERAA